MAGWEILIREEVTSNSNLAEKARAIGLQDCVILEPGNPIISDRILATTVQAIIGAVKVDGGDEAVTSLLFRIGLTHGLLVCRSQFWGLPYLLAC